MSSKDFIAEEKKALNRICNSPGNLLGMGVLLWSIFLLLIPPPECIHTTKESIMNLARVLLGPLAMVCVSAGVCRWLIPRPNQTQDESKED